MKKKTVFFFFLKKSRKHVRAKKTPKTIKRTERDEEHRVNDEQQNRKGRREREGEKERWKTGEAAEGRREGKRGEGSRRIVSIGKDVYSDSGFSFLRCLRNIPETRRFFLTIHSITYFFFSTPSLICSALFLRLMFHSFVTTPIWMRNCCFNWIRSGTKLDFLWREKNLRDLQILPAVIYLSLHSLLLCFLFSFLYPPLLHPFLCHLWLQQTFTFSIPKLENAVIKPKRI